MAIPDTAITRETVCGVCPMSEHGTDRDVLATALQWREAGHEVALVTVLRTWGSSPRPVGSLMAMRDDGIHHGSVSGGCVEEDLVRRYSDRQLAETLPSVVDYGINRQEATRFGLPCGGRLELLVESLEHTAPVAGLLQRVDAGELVRRRVCLNTGEVSVHPAGPDEAFGYNEAEVVKVFGPAWHLLLIGAGHLSRFVTQIAQTMDFRVIVCDPREEYQRAWNLEGAVFTAQMPDEAVQEYCNQPRSAVISLSHDPKLDDMALWQALSMDVFYVGALGSRANNDKRRERLRELGTSAEQLQKLRAPVGLAIGSRTPAEIAVAIMAEVIAARRGALRAVANATSAV